MQHTLGRAGLQNAYVIADYERSTVFVSQAVLREAARAQRLRAIHPPAFIARRHSDDILRVKQQTLAHDQRQKTLNPLTF